MHAYAVFVLGVLGSGSFSWPTTGFLRLCLSGAGLAVFLDMLWPLSLGLPLVGLGMLALGFSGKPWWNLWRSFGHV